MGLSRELRRLQAEHQQLRQLSDVILAELEKPNQEEAAELLPTWQEFRTLLVRHLKCEDWVLYPRLRTSTDAELSALAQQMVSEYGGLAERLERFETQWGGPSMSRDWRSYSSDVRTLLQTVQFRSDSEEQRLFPCAADKEAQAHSHGCDQPCLIRDAPAYPKVTHRAWA